MSARKEFCWPALMAKTRAFTRHPRSMRFLREKEIRPEVRSDAGAQPSPAAQPAQSAPAAPAAQTPQATQVAQAAPPRNASINEHGSPPAREARAALTNFEIQAPVTEAFLLGCMAQRFPGELLWDTAQTKVTNSEKANGFVDPPYRNGYTT